MGRVMRWRGSDGGLEQLVWSTDSGGMRADAVAIGGPPEEPHGLRYAIACDAAWRVREVRVESIGDREVHLLGDGDGHWTDRAGGALPLLDGCLDVDLAATPFTNTLPIRRLRLAVGASIELRVAYLPVPGLAPVPVTQRYTRLAPWRYRYEGYPAGFSAELEVDGDGLVLDYPGLFRRVL